MLHLQSTAMNVYHLSKDNYKQFAPFDIVAFYEFIEVIDRSKRVFRFEQGNVPPLHELFHVPPNATLKEAFPKSEWLTLHLGLGTGAWIHYSIWDELQSRVAWLSKYELGMQWREVILDILS